MDIHVRPYRSADEDKVLALSIRAWSSVFASMEQVLGTEIFVRLHGEDWRTYQEKSVREVLVDPAMQVVVADGERGLAGFVAATLLDPDRGLGEVTMLAVDPDAHEQGIGTVLTQHATAWLRDNGMRVEMIGTGGDPGHAPARRTYEKAGYTLIPMARYFKAL
jgi:GNAT superfamily N-acetyltransferase